MGEGNSTNESSGSFPRVRMWLCGSFGIEWIDPETGKAFSCTENELWRKDAAQAFSLMKLLLCQPGRQAHWDWIIEQFWPESIRKVTTHRLENIASTCYNLLRPLGDEPFCVQ